MSEILNTIDIDGYLQNASEEIVNYVATHPRLRVEDFIAPPDTDPTYEGLPPGVRELLAECQARKPLSVDAPKRFHSQFYEEVGRIRAQRMAVGTHSKPSSG